MTLPYKINDAVLLSREREGMIRYIGKVHFSGGIWCGIELIGGSLGTNDGKIQGRRYFSCPHNRGLFCKVNKVRRKFRERDHRSASRQKRKASIEQRLYHQSLVANALQSELELKKKYAQKAPYKMDVDNIEIRSRSNANWWNERPRSTPRSELRQKSSATKPFKPGPRDIGRTKNWKPIDYQLPDAQGGFMDERLHSPSTSKLKRLRSKKSNTASYKAGPRDIGRYNTKNTGWKPIELSKEEEERLMNSGGKFLDDRRRTKRTRKKNKSVGKIFKAGPRDIGRNNKSNWKPIELSKEEQDKLNSGSFLEDKPYKKRNKSSSKLKVFKAGPRDIGRNEEWNPHTKRQRNKQFKIAVNNANVDPKKLRRSKKENKALMKGKRVNKKNREKVYKPKVFVRKKKKKKKKEKKKKKDRHKKDVVIEQRERNQSMFDSFRKNTKPQKEDRRRTYHHDHRQSAKVRLNQTNKAIKKQKQLPPKSTVLKQRHSEKSISKTSDSKKFNATGYARKKIHNTAIVNNAKYTPYNAIASHRNSVHKDTNYQHFTAYNPANDNKENANPNAKPLKKYSASNESEAGLDLGDDGDAHFDAKKKPEIPKKVSVAELFDEDAKIERNGASSPKLSGAKTPTQADFDDNEIYLSDNEHFNGYQSPSGHEHIRYDSSPSGHDRVVDFGVGSAAKPVMENGASLTASLFSDSDDEHTKHIRQYNVPNKPLPNTPRKLSNKRAPNKPLPKSKASKKGKGKKGRVKGIAKYTGKWKVSFAEMKARRNKTSKTRNRRRSRASSRSSNKSEHNVDAFSYSIYKDGSVQIQPQNAFGWAGSANISFNEFHDRYEIHPIDVSVNDEYECISLKRNGTLYIEHFNAAKNSIKPMIGTGTRC